MPVVGSIIVLAVLLAAVAASSVMSAGDAAVRLVTRARARRLAEGGREGAPALERMVERAGAVMAATAFTLAVSYAVSAAAFGWWVEAFYASSPLWLSLGAGAALGVGLVFCLGEALPRTIAIHNPEGVGLAAAPFAMVLTRLTYPLARLLSWFWSVLIGLAKGEPGPEVPWVGEDEQRAGGEEEEPGEEPEEDIIEAVEDFREKIVREVMVPRPDMECLEDTATVEDALKLIEAAGYSRLPVYHETVDDIRGVLYAKDVLRTLSRGGTGESLVSDIVREAYFVPETKPVADLLYEMRRTAHMAIVADEYGGTAGLVTIEDLIEELVGEIFDEYDRPEQLVVDLGEGRFRVDSRLSVDEMNELFGTAVDREADSIGGLFTELAGQIPVVGETAQIEGLLLTVEKMEGARIRTIGVEPAPKRDGGEDDDRDQQG